MKQGSMSRKRLVLVLVLTMILTSFSSLGVFAAGHEQTLVLLHTNDMHGRVFEGQYDGMGLPKIATYANEYREMYDNVLLLDAGDALHGLPIATLVEGESMIELMNLMGYNAMTAGNHDFNYGQERLQELDEMADFPILAANVYKEDGTRLLDAYVLFEYDGFTVAVFGLATPETMMKTHPNNVIGLTFSDPLSEAEAMVDELDDMADVIILLSHLGSDMETEEEQRSTTVATLVDGIDVLVDGHSHTMYEAGEMHGDTLVVSAGYNGVNLGVVEITLADGEVTAAASLITKEEAAETVEEAEVLALATTMNEAQEVLMAEVVGETAVELIGVRELVRAGETNLGNIITDSMVWATDADFAFTNGGGIRVSIDAGPITKGEVIAVLPFGNVVVTKEMSGAAVLEALEVASDAYPEPAGKFAHVSGMTYTIDPNQPAGQRISNVTIKGEPLVLDEMYIMATNDYLAAGGDQMAMFVSAPTLSDYVSMDEAFMQYLSEMGVVSPEVEGRITTLALEEQPEVVEPMPEMPVMPEMPAMEYGVYVVQSGDVLWRIAREHESTWEFLAELNQLSNPHLIFPGDEIMYPAH